MKNNKTGQSEKKRDGSIDAMKFLLITMVVFDHCAIKFKLDTAPGFEHIYQLFQAINMPIFVFISGFFMRRTTDRKKFYKGILAIFETYLVFQIPFFLRLIILNGDYNPLHILQPGWAMWYLPALIIWRILAYELPEKIISKKTLLITTLFVISIAGGFIPTKAYALQRIITFAPMFFIGFYCGKTKVLDHLRKINPIIPALVVLAYFVILFVANPHTTPLFQQNLTYYNKYLSPTGTLVTRVVWHVVTTIVGAAAASLMLRIKSKKLAEMGMHTLLFYVGHIFILNLICPLLKKVGLLQPNVLYMLVMFCLIIAFFTLLSRFKWHKYILNPVTTYLDRH